jgi:hypothetical protein
MMKHLLSILTLALLLPIAGNAQKLKLTKGSLAPLKGQKEVLLEFDYSSFAVGKFKNESDYKAKKVEEYNKKEAGRGDKWSDSWENDKSKRFPEKFVTLYNKTTKGFTVSEGASSAQYKMVVVLTFLEPGYNVGVSSKPASANFAIRYYEVQNPDKLIAEISVVGAPGATAMGMDFDTGQRISECFAITAKRLAALTAKLTK